MIYNKRDISDTEKEKFWSSIAFHEFVQRPMKNIEERPNITDFQMGAKVLIQIIDLLNIDICIFLGTDINKFNAVKEKIEFKLEGWEDNKINNANPKFLKIKELEHVKSIIVFIKHPSQMFSWDLWNKFIVKCFTNYSDFIRKIS